jgi:hypothetical protein
LFPARERPACPDTLDCVPYRAALDNARQCQRHPINIIKSAQYTRAMSCVFPSAPYLWQYWDSNYHFPVIQAEEVFPKRNEAMLGGTSEITPAPVTPQHILSAKRHTPSQRAALRCPPIELRVPLTLCSPGMEYMPYSCHDSTLIRTQDLQLLCPPSISISMGVSRHSIY